MNPFFSRRAHPFSLLIILGLTMASCQPGSVVAPTLPPSPTSVPTTTPLPTPTATAQPTQTPTAIPPTATATPPALFGTLIGIDGPMQQAEVTLTTYPGEACEKLATTTETLSDSDQQQLTECSQELPAVFSDELGRYRITDLAPGWYSVSLTWVLSKKPDALGLMSMAFHDGFLTVLGESTETPGIYLGLAVMNEPFYYSGEAQQELSFDYNHADASAP